MPSTVTIRVKMLDDTIHPYEIKPTSSGAALLQEIMKNLDVLESDYFGVFFDEGDGITFLDPRRQVGKQIKGSAESVLNFGVKFFTPDPSQMQDEYTRYLFALEVKRNIGEGTLHCAESTALEMASYVIQAEFGDWNASECSTTAYLNDTKLFPRPTEEQLVKISQLHKNLIGKKPAEADYSLLDIARRLDLYGVRLYPALDAQSTPISLAVSHAGVIVFQEFKKINAFNWARIRKLSFKRKSFLIKLRHTESDDRKSRSYRDILVFVMNSRDACKNFWKICVEHHAFFRLEAKPQAKPKPVVLSRGSSFHYSGKTQKELLELVRNSNFHRTNFIRTTSRKRIHNTTASSDDQNDSKFQLDLNSPASKQSNSSAIGGSIASPSSTITEDQGSYMIEDTTRSADTSQNVTTADVSPDPASPDWQMNSESLHSSATPVDNSAAVHAEPKGNGSVGFYTPHHTPATNLDETDNSYRNGDLLRNKKKGSRKNDDGLESVETLLQNVSTRDRKSIISNTSTNVGLYAGSKSLSFDVLRVASCDNIAPPLPPKGRGQASNGDGSYDNLKNMGVRDRRSLGDRGGSLGVSGSEDPFVNDSVVNLSAQGAAMAPDVKAQLGEEKIAVGHYAVPKRPPTPPDGNLNSPRWDRTSQILDKEINEAMTELYKAIGGSGPSDRRDGREKSIVIDGTAPVVVSSSDENESRSESPLDDDTMLAPIKMDFDDFGNLFASKT